MADRVELKQNCTMLESIFSSDGDHLEFKPIRRVLLAHRKILCEYACRWLTKKAQLFDWENQHGWAHYDEMANKEYTTWKREQKPRSCETTLPNLVKAYKSFFGCSEGEAKQQVVEDAEWVDTSDDEGPKDEQILKDVSGGSPSHIQPTDGSRDRPITFIGANSPPVVSKSKHIVLRPPAVISISEGDDESRSDTRLICLDESARDSEPRSDNEIICLDDLTNTQVLYGHGSFGGLALSQPEQGGEMLGHGNHCPRVEEFVGIDGTENVFSAVPGLCSLSQDLSPCTLLDFDNDVLLGAVDSLPADSQAPESGPLYILGSQDLPEVFRTTTHFIDLMCAQSQPSQSTQIVKLLGNVDERIATARGTASTSKRQNRKLKLKTK